MLKQYSAFDMFDVFQMQNVYAFLYRREDTANGTLKEILRKLAVDVTFLHLLKVIEFTNIYCFQIFETDDMISVSDIQLSCYRILNSLYCLGTSNNSIINR